jgi:hypothetical protein
MSELTSIAVGDANRQAESLLVLLKLVPISSIASVPADIARTTPSLTPEHHQQVAVPISYKGDVERR